MFFAGLWERQSPLYCRPRYNPRLLTIWEEAWEADTAAWEEGAATGEDTAAWGWHRIFLAVGDLAAHLDTSTIAMISRFGITNLATFVIAISIVMADSSAIITIVSSSPLILPPLASLGGTPTTTITPIMAMILIMATEQLTTPNIGLI
jgi:hypothetical protein